jgi:translation initiation factor IF-1
MPKEDVILARGEVVEAFPSALFRVRLENNHTVIGHLSGRLRQNNIKVLVGDWVDVELSPYDLGRGRITYRHRSRPAPAC